MGPDKCAAYASGYIADAYTCCGRDHDDVIKWKHFPRYWPFVRGIHWWLVDSPHKGQWRGAFMLYLICAWTNGWENNQAPMIWDAIAFIMTSLWCAPLLLITCKCVNNVWIVHTKSFFKIGNLLQNTFVVPKPSLVFISIFLNTATGLDWVFLAQWEVHGRHIQR